MQHLFFLLFLQDLKGIKEFEPFLGNKSLGEVLQKSEVEAYLTGVCEVIETYEKIKKFVPLKDEKVSSNTNYCVPFICKLCFAKPFSDVLFIEGPDEKDFWFNWEGDAEPVKIIYGEKKTQALCRFHWQHKTVEPYLDNQNRVHVFFLPHFHSPVVRKKTDLLFQVVVKSFEGGVYDDFKVQSRALAKWFKNKYWSQGLKTAHPPPVNYGGWSHADRNN